MVKRGQEQVSSMDSPKQGQDRDPRDSKIKHKGDGSHSGRRARPTPEGAGSDG